MSQDPDRQLNEVVLSIGIKPQDLLIGPRLGEILGHWFEEHADIKSVALYEMPPEGESIHPESAAARAPNVSIGAELREPRYWLTSRDEIFVIQVQRDYLALNWRRREPAQEYVQYKALRARFSAILETIAANLSVRGGALSPVRAEMTYVNLIEPSSLWSRLSEAHRVVQVGFPDQDNYDLLVFGYSKPIREEKIWVGRTHVTFNSAYNWLKEEPRLQLNLTARSGSLREPTVGRSFQFFDLAHDELNSTFRTLLTPEASELWGYR